MPESALSIHDLLQMHSYLKDISNPSESIKKTIALIEDAVCAFAQTLPTTSKAN